MNDFSDFYDSEIEIITESTDEMYHGVLLKGNSATMKIVCDVQPVDRERFYSEYGYAIDAEYKVFCNVFPEIEIGKNIQYNGNSYIIAKITDWKDYYILYLKAVR